MLAAAPGNFCSQERLAAQKLRAGELVCYNTLANLASSSEKSAVVHVLGPVRLQGCGHLYSSSPRATCLNSSPSPEATAAHSFGSLCACTPTPRRSITMADTIEQLKDKLQALEADSAATRTARNSRRSGVSCARPRRRHEAWCRAVRRFGHRSGRRLRARHCFQPKRCKPWPSSGLHRKPAKAAKAAPRAWPRATASRSRGSPATERGSKYARAPRYRRRLPKKARRSPERNRRRSSKMPSWTLSEEKLRKVAVTTADVRNAGGALYARATGTRRTRP